MNVVEAASADETLEAVRRLGPDLMVLDVELLNADGLELVRHIGAERVPAVVFVAGDDPEIGSVQKS